MKRASLLSIAVSVSLISAGVSAHHSFAEFNDQELITVKGVVTQFRLVNPHAMMSFDVKDEEGKTVRWEVEFDGRTHIARRGWTDDTIRPGEVITVTGNPARSGSPFMFFISAVKGDGTVLVRPYKESFENAEAERAALREKRQR